MTPRRRALAVALVVAATAALGWSFRERLVLSWLDWRTPKTTFAEREALIGPALKFYAPDTPPPWPVVLQFHGCAGVKPSFHEQYARAAVEAGYLAVVVDSNGPRGIDRARALETVCEGKALIGQERAGDVAAALDIVRKRTDVDMRRVALAGWSHGAWTVMDYLALTGAKHSFAGVRDAPPPPPLAGVFLVYPHCGVGAWTRLVGWRRVPPTLALVAGADTVVDPKACPPLLARLAAKGPVETHLYPTAEHSFDDAWLPRGYESWFDPAARDDAVRRYRTFLSGLDAPG